MGEKGLGECEACGSMYPVVVGADGSHRVLANAARCECGSQTFRLLGADDAGGV